MELRDKYPAEANCHRNMLRRAKAGRTVHPQFYKFRDFLRAMGPRPCAQATVDRINNSDPEYAPAKVRWADKPTQNSNKGDTLLFHCAKTGESFTTSRLAKLQKVDPGTIRTRWRRGWTVAEIIAGKRLHHVQVLQVEDKVTPKPSEIDLLNPLSRQSRNQTGRSRLRSVE